MKTILRRKDSTSIFCPPVRKHSSSLAGRTKVIEATVAFTLIFVGLFIILYSL